MTNSKTTLPRLLALGTLLLPLAVRAQSPSPSPAPSATPSVSAPAPEAAPAAAGTGDQSKFQRHQERREEYKQKMEALTPEEKAKLRAAHEKAMQDPAVKAAEADKEAHPREFHKAMHDAVLRADPSVAPILAKLRPEHPGHGEL